MCLAVSWSAGALADEGVTSYAPDESRRAGGAQFRRR